MAIINKRIQHSVVGKKAKQNRKPQQENKLKGRMRSHSTKLDEGNVRVRLIMTVGDNKAADINVDNYATPSLNIRIENLHPNQG